ncbi:MAG TPA: VOC family protein [Frankiaceae bacterium]|nr:VOC family protein [Frankiaceae bacterium]
MNGLNGLEAVSIDCTGDPTAIATWWQGLIGGDVVEQPEGYAELYAPGFPCLQFLPTPDAKSVKNRLHLDLRSDDFDAAIEAALAHGATRADDVYAGGSWQVLRDPEGNEFCILRPHPHAT